MDFAHPYLRPRPGGPSTTPGEHAESYNPISAFGAPGNLGERAGTFPAVDVAGNVEDAVDAIADGLGDGSGPEGEAEASEASRLRQQAKEVDTVRRYLARTLERAREVRFVSLLLSHPPVPADPVLSPTVSRRPHPLVRPF